jgi:tRNA threonylcarbamoyladenosine biosynthesis protein TsaE
LLGSRLKGGEIIELRSDLGGGKTTFVQGLAKGAGSQDRVSSPTFTLSRIYKTKNFDIHHFDFYRLNDPGILAEQLAEVLAEPNVVVVEWADIVNDVLPDNKISIEFKPAVQNPEERRVIIHYPQELSDIIRKVETDWEKIEP